MLAVTFTRVVPSQGRVHLIPVVRGSAARTELIELVTDSAVGQLAAEAGEDVVVLDCDVDCWVAIGPDPVAAVPVDVASDGQAVGVHKVIAGQRTPFGVDLGDKVAVIAA